MEGKVYNIEVTNTTDTTVSNTYPYYPNTTTTTNPYTYTWWWGWSPTTVYKYQIKCPRCRKMNWLELDKITPCHNCKSQLKAVSKKADYEVPITE